jgi:hypothetical protein
MTQRLAMRTCGCGEEALCVAGGKGGFPFIVLCQRSRATKPKPNQNSQPFPAR